MSNLRVKIVSILAVFVVFAAVGVYPLIAGYYGVTQPAWLMSKALKLGLDLKGGVHLVLRVQTDTALRVETELQMERLREALRTSKIPVGNLTQPSPVEFRVEGVPAEQDAALREAAIDVEANYDRTSPAGGTYAFTMRPLVQGTLREEAVVQAIQTIERRVNELGVTEPSIARQGADQILVQLPGVTDVVKAKSIMGSQGILELRIVERIAGSREELLVNGQVPAGMDIVPGSSGASTSWASPNRASHVRAPIRSWCNCLASPTSSRRRASWGRRGSSS